MGRDYAAPPFESKPTFAAIPVTAGSRLLLRAISLALNAFLNVELTISAIGTIDGSTFHSKLRRPMIPRMRKRTRRFGTRRIPDLPRSEVDVPELSADEVRDLAYALIDRFGERSVAVANHQALKARQSGDGFGLSAWRWIGGLAADILRSDPDEFLLRDVYSGK